MASDELIYVVRYENDAKSLQEVQKALDGIEQTKKKAVGSGEADIEGIQKRTQATRASIKAQVELQDTIDSTRAELQELSKAQKENGELTAMEAAMQAELKLELKAASAEYNKNARDLIALSTEVNTVNASYNDLVQRNKQLSIQMRAVPLDDTTGKLAKLKEEYRKNNDALKSFDKELGNHQREVGNYKLALENTGSQLSALPGPIGQVGQSVQGLTTVLKANPIFLLAGVVAGVAVALSKLQPVMDRIKQAFAALSAVGQILIDNVFAVLSGNLQDVNFEMKEAVVNAVNLTKAEQELYRTETQLIVTREKLRAQATEDKKIADDTTQSYDDRIAAAQRAIDAENELARQATMAAEERFRILSEQANLASSTDEELREVAEAEAELFRIRQSNAERTLELQNKLNSLITQQKVLADAAVQSALDAFAALEAAREKANQQSADVLISEDDIDVSIDLADNFFSKRLSLEQEYLKQAVLATNEADRQKFDSLAKFEQEKKRFLALGLSEEQANAKASERIEMQKTQMVLSQQAIRVQNAQFAAQTLLGLASQVFQDSKGLAIAQALINTYQSATASYKSLAGIPVVGPALGSAAAGLAVAAGLKQVQAIRSTEIGGGGGAVNAYGSVSPTTAKIASSATAPQSQVNVGVQNNLSIDERGIALASRRGEELIRSEQVNLTG